MKKENKSLRKLRISWKKIKYIATVLGVTMVLSGCSNKLPTKEQRRTQEIVREYEEQSRVEKIMEECGEQKRAQEIIDEYNESGEELSLEEEVIICKEVNKKLMEAYQDNTLKDKDWVDLRIEYIQADNNIISSLPRGLRSLELKRNDFIDDLSALPEACPNLQRLTISNCYSIVDYSFLKRLTHLKEFYIVGDSVGITEELIAYLDDSRIKHNLDDNLVYISTNIRENAQFFFNDRMSTNEKVLSAIKRTQEVIPYDDEISNYLSNEDNFSQKEKEKYQEKIHEYNGSPLSTVLNRPSSEGVCINQAVYMVVLLREAGVKAWLMNDHEVSHAWVIVKAGPEQEKHYYYLDPTNFRFKNGFSGLIQNTFETYLEDPCNPRKWVTPPIEEVISRYLPDAIRDEVIIDSQRAKIKDLVHQATYFSLAMLLGLPAIIPSPKRKEEIKQLIKKIREVI